MVGFKGKSHQIQVFFCADFPLILPLLSTEVCVVFVPFLLVRSSAIDVRFAEGASYNRLYNHSEIKQHLQQIRHEEIPIYRHFRHHVHLEGLLHHHRSTSAKGDPVTLHNVGKSFVDTAELARCHGKDYKNEDSPWKIALVHTMIIYMILYIYDIVIYCIYI